MDNYIHDSGESQSKEDVADPECPSFSGMEQNGLHTCSGRTPITLLIFSQSLFTFLETKESPGSN